MKAAVLGKPVAHSLSPVLHRAAYEALGLADWTYELVECDEQGLAGYVESRGPEWAGLSLTMPLKRTVLPLLDHVDHLAAATGGANTVVFRPEGRYGYNTDVQGIVDALTEAGAPVPGSVTILGAGATACSALAAVGELGATGADVVARDPSRAGGLLATADRLGLQARLRPWADLGKDDAVVPDLLISTVPAGAANGYSERVRLTRQAPPAVMDSAGPGGGGRRVGGRERLRHAAAPGGGPGRADDRQAGPPGGDAPGWRGRTSPPRCQVTQIPPAWARLVRPGRRWAARPAG
jgi:shikimate dehydrogenase